MTHTSRRTQSLCISGPSLIGYAHALTVASTMTPQDKDRERCLCVSSYAFQCQANIPAISSRERYFTQATGVIHTLSERQMMQYRNSIRSFPIP